MQLFVDVNNENYLLFMYIRFLVIPSFREQMLNFCLYKGSNAMVKLKTNNLSEVMGLNASQLKVLLCLAHLAKNNHIEMKDTTYKNITDLTKLSKKTIQNNLSDLVKAGILVKAGSLPNYVIDPIILVTNSEEKALKHFEAASVTKESFIEGLDTEKKKSRGDFKTKKLEAELANRKHYQDHSKLFEEARKRFGQ